MSTLPELRQHLFDEIKALRSGRASAKEVARAEAVAKLAGQLIGSAKVELQAMKLLGVRPASGGLLPDDLQKLENEDLTPEQARELERLRSNGNGRRS